MSDNPKGSSAFPVHARSVDDGMTIRDYFAAAALQTPYTQHDTDPDKAAEWAYQIADAMLKARKA